MHNYISACIHRRQLPAQLTDFPEQAHRAVGELGKVRCIDTGGGFCRHDGVDVDIVVAVPGLNSLVWVESALM